MEQQIADLLRQNQDLIRALQIRDDSHSHKVTVQFDKFDEENENFDSFIERFETYLDVQNVPIANRAKACFASKKANAKSVKQKQVTLLNEVEDRNRIPLYELKIQDYILHEEEPKRPPIMINLKIENKSCSMELDTGERVRTVPFALKGRVENEIDRLEKEGIIEKVDSSEWATPVVPVVKSDGSIRLCTDYSVTLNPNLIVPQHPLPRLDEILVV
ncbi:retrovirus-related Pol polyprotein from transposon 412 [Trichonephila clavipes]|nr:retrovirus-related Pol polyprotein from transposon 412 [Trichonephila clavipes]